MMSISRGGGIRPCTSEIRFVGCSKVGIYQLCIRWRMLLPRVIKHASTHGLIIYLFIDCAYARNAHGHRHSEQALLRCDGSAPGLDLLNDQNPGTREDATGATISSGEPLGPIEFSTKIGAELIWAKFEH